MGQPEGRPDVHAIAETNEPGSRLPGRPFLFYRQADRIQRNHRSARGGVGGKWGPSMTTTSITNGMTITTTGNHSTVSVTEKNGDVVANIGPTNTTDSDFIIARHGRIAALYLFFDKLP